MKLVEMNDDRIFKYFEFYEKLVKRNIFLNYHKFKNVFSLISIKKRILNSSNVLKK
jgi:hypothetical protein